MLWWLEKYVFPGKMGQLLYSLAMTGYATRSDTASFHTSIFFTSLHHTYNHQNTLLCLGKSILAINNRTKELL